MKKALLLNALIGIMLFSLAGCSTAGTSNSYNKNKTSGSNLITTRGTNKSNTIATNQATPTTTTFENTSTNNSNRLSLIKPTVEFPGIKFPKESVKFKLDVSTNASPIQISDTPFYHAPRIFMNGKVANGFTQFCNLYSTSLANLNTAWLIGNKSGRIIHFFIVCNARNSKSINIVIQRGAVVTNIKIINILGHSIEPIISTPDYVVFNIKPDITYVYTQETMGGTSFLTKFKILGL